MTTPEPSRSTPLKRIFAKLSPTGPFTEPGPAESSEGSSAKEAAEGALPEIADAVSALAAGGQSAASDWEHLGIGSTIFAVKPGDGSAREQAASCQKVLGGWANIANEYATKRYRSNLINWGMLPFVIPEGDLPFKNGDWIFVPGIREAVAQKQAGIAAYAVQGGEVRSFTMTLGDLTEDERTIILDGCLINYYRNH